MFSRFHLFRRKPRANRAAPVTLPPTTLRTNPNTNTSINRISTLSNATTLHPLQNEIIPASLLSSFPAPPTYQPSPLTPEAAASQPDPQQPQPQPQHPHTLLPNTSQSSLDTLADPLGRLPEAPDRLSTFEAFISHARQAEAQRIERERYMVRAWLAAEEERRRTAGRSLSGDPWRGRFGPPASETNHFPTGLGIGMGGGGYGSGYAPQVRFNGGMRMPPTRMHRVERSSVERERPRTSGGGVKAAKVWLRKVTSLERLRA